MSQWQENDARDALRMLEPGPVALLTSDYREQPNVMAAAWIRAVSLEPVMIGVSIHPSRLSHLFLSATEQFGLNLVTADLLTAMHLCGIASGREVDKFEVASLTPETAVEIEAPMVAEAVAQIECAVTDRITVGDHDLFVARVLQVRSDPESFQAFWQTGEEAGQLLHHLGGDQYAALGRTWQAKLPEGFE